MINRKDTECILNLLKMAVVYYAFLLNHAFCIAVRCLASSLDYYLICRNELPIFSTETIIYAVVKVADFTSDVFFVTFISCLTNISDKFNKV